MPKTIPALYSGENLTHWEATVVLTPNPAGSELQGPKGTDRRSLGFQGVLRVMKCDVLDEPFKNDRIIGLTHAQLKRTFT